MKENKKWHFVNIYESEMYMEDDCSEDYLQDKLGILYTEAKELIKTYKFTEDDLEAIDKIKTWYYQGDFWNDTETFRDSINWIDWNFYYDKEHNEIIINYWTTLEWDYIAFYDEWFDWKEELYRKVFDAFINQDYSWVVEADYIEMEWDWWMNIKEWTNKADFIIKYRWGTWYWYRFFEYDLIK